MINEDEVLDEQNEPRETPEEVIEDSVPPLLSSCCEAPITANGNLMVCTECNGLCDPL